MEKIKVLAFCGSLRKGSYTKQLLNAVKKLAPDEIEVKMGRIDNLPLYNQDLDERLPASVIELHNSIQEADAVLFASPEYNRSYTGVLKNAIDWGSRPDDSNKWEKKPAALMGCSPYSLGGFGAVSHLRQVLSYLEMYVLPQPEFYLSMAGDKFNEKEELIDQPTKNLIAEFWEKFSELIKLNQTQLQHQ